MIDHLLSNEMKLLLLCAGDGVRTAPKTKFKGVAQNQIDWDLVVEISLRHGLTNFLYKNLKNKYSDLVPADTLSKLQANYSQNSKNNLFYCANLIQIINLLKKKNIAAVPFKGPVQAQYLYNDIGLRSFSDLDILVKKEDALKAAELLVNNRMTMNVKIPESQLAQYLEKENFFPLTNKSGSIVIDLHWEITGRYSLCPLYLDEFSENLENVKLLNQDILSLSCEDMLIQLCVHGTSHCWNKLEMVYSVAEIVKANRIDNWNGVISRATRFKCKRMLYLGLLLAEKLFEIVLPNEVKISMDKDDRIIKLSKRIVNNILKEEKPYIESLSWRFSPTHFIVRDSFFDMVFYLFRLLFRPTVREWINYPLPDYLLFLYYGLRPCRLLKDCLRRKNA